MSQTEVQLVKGLNLDPAAPADATVVDSSGRFLVGPTASVQSDGVIQAQGSSGGNIALYQNADAATAGSKISFLSDGGATAREQARIFGYQTTTSASGGYLGFSTTASAGSSPTERLRISQSGAFGLSGANYGTSGQVLTSQGSGSAPQWATASTGNDYNFASGSASGSSITVGSLPSNAVQIILNFASLGWTTGSTILSLKLGHSGGINSADYSWTQTSVGQSSAYTVSSSSMVLNNGFTGTSERMYGTVTLNRLTNNAWIVNYQGRSGGSTNYILHGSGWAYSGSSNPVSQLQLLVSAGSMNTGNYNVNVFTE